MFVLDANDALQHDGDLLELRSLAGSIHPGGDTILATLTDECPELTRPVCSSIRFGRAGSPERSLGSL